jgi:vitamin B12 transporter
MKKFAKYILMGITLITVLLLNNNAIGEIANNMKPVVVTASRIEENIDETGSAVSIVTAEDIKQSGATQVKEVLREVTGIDVVSTGAFGGTSSLYMRGANPNHTRMMIDGVKVYDPIRSDGAFNFANLTANNIERIEVIRGGQSSVWGSSAMGGVINIITKKGQEDSEISAKFEGGSHDTYSETVNASGLIGALSYATSFTRTDSEGISKAGNRYGNHEEDGYQNTSFSGRFNYKVSDDIDIGLITRYTNTRFEFDDAAGVGGDDVNRRGISEQTLFSSFIDQDILENWSHHFQTSWTRNVRQDNDDIDIIDTSISDYRRDWFNGVNLAFDWQHIINPVEWDTISTGIQYDREEGKTRTITRQLATNFGYYFENKLRLFDNLQSCLSLSRD